MKKKTTLLLIIVLGIPLILSGCMPGDGSYSSSDTAGFFWGIWHGWIAPISLIRGIFNSNIRIYEIFNTGWTYDLGFYIAIISGFGGISFFRDKGNK